MCSLFTSLPYMYVCISTVMVLTKLFYIVYTCICRVIPHPRTVHVVADWSAGQKALESMANWKVFVEQSSKMAIFMKYVVSEYIYMYLWVLCVFVRVLFVILHTGRFQGGHYAWQGNIHMDRWSYLWGMSSLSCYDGLIYEVHVCVYVCMCI